MKNACFIRFYFLFNSKLLISNNCLSLDISQQRIWWDRKSKKHHVALDVRQCQHVNFWGKFNCWPLISKFQVWLKRIVKNLARVHVKKCYHATRYSDKNSFLDNTKQLTWLKKNETGIQRQRLEHHQYPN